MTTRLQQLHHWLSEIFDSKDYQLEPASGDASFRCYFRLIHNNETFIVMDAPPTQENSTTFINIAERLLAVSINVPRIIEKDLQQGFLLLSDLGNKQYLNELTEESADRLYQDAMQTLLHMQQQADTTGLSPYDEKLLLQEMELFRVWLLERHAGLELTTEMERMIGDVFKFLADEALAQPKVFVHRDYHSRNLMLCASSDSQVSLANPGVLDFQDAVCGPFTYDLVSLLKDCYIKWPAEQIRSWAIIFFEQLACDYSEFDQQQLIRWFDLMGVQRHLKASGIFARLYHRDGKSGYLKDIPRTLSYIVDLKQDYPELQGLIELIQNQLMDSPVMILATGENK
jgi:N-acetylmuramate 1-kinase